MAAKLAQTKREPNQANANNLRAIMTLVARARAQTAKVLTVSMRSENNRLASGRKLISATAAQVSSSAVAAECAAAVAARVHLTGPTEQLATRARTHTHK